MTASDKTSRQDTVPEILAERVAESPHAIAFCYEAEGSWREIRWSEFGRRVDALAGALRRHGLEPGEHVGMLAPTGLAWELFHHAILRAGGVVVGLEPHDTAERLRWIAAHAELRMLIVQDMVLLRKLDEQQLANYRIVIVLDSTDALAAGNRKPWTQLEPEGAAHLSDSLPTPSANSPATLIYTSGTTGQPKGILYRHEQVALAVRAISQAYPSLPVGARFVCWLPLSNLFQRIMNLAAMQTGGTVYLVSNPLAVLKALPIARPDVFIGVPRFYEKLHEGIVAEVAKKPRPMRALIDASLRVGERAARATREGKPRDLPLRLALRFADRLVLQKLRQVMGGNVRFMVTGSAPTPIPLLEFFDAIGLPLYEAYGMSENVVPMALNRPAECRLGTVGKPLPYNETKLAEDGELLVRGAGVFAGYHKDDRADIFTADGYYRTGDFAKFDDDGFLRLGGRKSEIIKTSTGRRISPLGIEALLQEIAYVDRAVVVGAGRKALAAILIVKADYRLSFDGSLTQNSRAQRIVREQDLRADVTRTLHALPAHEHPIGYLLSSYTLSIEAGELTPNLKLKRKAIESRFESELDQLYRQAEAKPNEPAARVCN